MSDKTLELQIRITADEAARIVSSLKGQIKELAEESGKYAKSEGAALKQSFKEAETTAKETKKGIEDIIKAVGKLTEVVVATKALSVIKDMGAFALNTADNFQTAKNNFGILLGDMEAGAGLFNEIKAFSDVTPFDLDALNQATGVLISAKVPLSELQNQLTKFGDLSQGNTQRFTSYINAFSQASAKGKADMQILNTYLNQGVPILDALAKNFGKTTSEIVEMSSKGQISFADFSKALDDLTASGGQYFGGMELASKSLAAMKEGLTEATNTLAASFGEMLMPVAIAVIQIFTDITNAINESPLLKGLLIGAIVALTGYLAAMAVKAGIAFAAQMSLNFAIGALNPVVLATTIAVAGLAAGYTVHAANQQKAAREAENMAYQQRKLNDAVNNGSDSWDRYFAILFKGEDDQLRERINKIKLEINNLKEIITSVGQDIADHSIFNHKEDEINKIFDELGRRRTSFIESMFAGSDSDKIRKINEQLSIARKYLTDPISGSEQSQLQLIIRNLNEELDKLTANRAGIDRLAADWKEAWAEIWGQFKADQNNDLFYSIELERRKKLEDAYNNHIRSANQETLDQINEYYNAQRREILQQLANEEDRIQRELSVSKINSIRHEFQETLKAINMLETQRIIAAGNSEAEIAAIHERFTQMRKDAVFKFNFEIEKAELDEARNVVKNWQEELSDNLLIILLNLDFFSSKAAVILSNLGTQLAELSATATLSGFEEFGRALGQGEDAAESMSRALAHMSRQILQQLPMMFLQAGLQLIANGQWPLGLGFIAAAGSSAIISGYVDGMSQHAKGSVFNEYGQVAQAYAAGGTFTNQIVSTPTFFQHGGKLGVMGEAGPESIMPLCRMSNGDLGVAASVSGTHLTINIINNSGENVRKEERTDSNGNRQIDVVIGDAMNKHIASGKADHVMSGRYGIRAPGV
ncbi:MAG: tape measure protein [Treponema sp.]|nr:tape measure protein [Treponema sp.]